MIKDLPAHSRFAVRRSLQIDAGEKEDLPEVEGLDEALKEASLRRWRDPEHEERALMVNALWRLYEAVPEWEKGKRPEMPTLGPEEWQPKKKPATKKEHSGKPVDVFDVMSSLGWSGGPGG